MNIRNVLIPVALVAALALVASDASAAPVGSTPTSAVFGGRVHLGGGIGIDIPIGRRPAHVHTVQSGYWTTVTEQVWTPGQLIGYDRHGHPIVTPGHYVLVQRQVWVPTVQQVIHQPRPVGTVHVGFGGRWRIR
jgi:hypothetical protein